jgi:hypothetical protein
MEMGCEVWNRFTIHLTPKHESWLNQAELEIGLFSRQCVGRRRIPDLTSFRRETQAWTRRMNRGKVKINWKFNRRTARLASSVINAHLQAVNELPGLLRRSGRFEVDLIIIRECKSLERSCLN